MKPFALLPLALVLAIHPTIAGQVRTWTDTTGQYTVDAALIAFDEQQAILERVTDKQLGAVAIDKLSEQDQEYLKSKVAVDEADDLTGELQKWTLQSGLQLNGRLVDYGSREVVLRRSRGNVYVNDRLFSNLPAIYQRIVPLIVANAGNKVDDARSLERWLASRGGQPQSLVVDGVVLELENGDEYGVPFFMFREQDLRVLQPGWEDWLAANTKQDYAARQEESLRLQVEAAQYRQQQQQENWERRRIAQMQLVLQAVDAGITSVWEVTLYPVQGNVGPPQWVPVFARDSRAATQQALLQNPGYVAGPVRRVSR